MGHVHCVIQTESLNTVQFNLTLVLKGLRVNCICVGQNPWSHAHVYVHKLYDHFCKVRICVHTVP